MTRSATRSVAQVKVFLQHITEAADMALEGEIRLPFTGSLAKVVRGVDSAPNPCRRKGAYLSGGLHAALPPCPPHRRPPQHYAELLLALTARERLEHGIPHLTRQWHRRRNSLRGSECQPDILQT